MNPTSVNSTDGIFIKLRGKIIYFTKFSVYVLLSWVYYFLYEYGFLKRLPPPSTISSLSDEYIKKHTASFLKSYEQNDSSIMNENIEKCFYDQKLHAKAVEKEDNELEKTWRRRIMIENTPRGNVVMHYDAFKQGFVYYSDNSNIPYFVINAVIMKYVLMYRCRDFFLDDQITPEGKSSVLLGLDNKPEREEAKENTNENTNDNKPKENIPKSSAFAKLKNYNTVSIKSALHSNETTANNDTTTTKKYSRNKVIYSGKLSNFNILQPIPKKRHVPFSSTITDNVEMNADAQKHVFTYKDFKRMKQDSSLKL
jgi:hypothetical protein